MPPYLQLAVHRTLKSLKVQKSIVILHEPLERYRTLKKYRIPSSLYMGLSKETYNFKEPTNRSHPIAGDDGGLDFREFHGQQRWSY